MNRTSTLLLAFAIPFLLHAQKALTLRDAILKAGTDYAPERLRGLQWIEGSNTYNYIKDDKLMRAPWARARICPSSTWPR